MSVVTRVNRIVGEFLEQNPDLTLETWKSEKIQKKLKGVLNSKKKDPDAPKKPKSAYLYFCEEKNPEVKEYLLSIGKKEQVEIVSETARRWKVLTSSTAKKDQAEHARYVAMANEDKQRYQEELQNSSVQTGKKPKSSKRAKSAYMFFCEEKRPEVAAEGYRGKDIVVRIGYLWTEMTKDPTRAAEYQKYLDMAKNTVPPAEPEPVPNLEAEPEPEPEPEPEVVLAETPKKKSTRPKKKVEAGEVAVAEEPVAAPKKKTRNPK